MVLIGAGAGGFGAASGGGCGVAAGADGSAAELGFGVTAAIAPPQMLSPNGRTMTGLSREFGVPEATLYRWRNGATLGGMSSSSSDDKPNATTASHDWSAEEKLAVVLEAAAVPDAELGEFLRRKGLHEYPLHQPRLPRRAA